MGVQGSVSAAFSDERIVGRVRAGDEDAFARIYDRHAAELLSFCRHMVSSQHDAEDALQQTFLKAYDGIRRSREPITLRPWLYAIARNECISLIRRRRDTPSGSESIEPSTAGLARQVEEREELRSMFADIAKLPTEQREALLLSGVQKMSGGEVAEVLDTDPERVKALVFRARRSLCQRREARDVGCDAIREQLSVLRGGSLRRKVLREHLLECDGCQAFRIEVRRQRQLMAAIVPVPLPLALKGLCVPGAAVAAKLGAGSAGAGAALAAKGAGGAAVAGVGAKIAVGAVLVAGVALGGTGLVKSVTDRSPAIPVPAADGGRAADPSSFQTATNSLVPAVRHSGSASTAGGSRADEGGSATAQGAPANPGSGDPSPGPGSSEAVGAENAAVNPGPSPGAVAPAEAGPPEHAGPPATAGPPEHAGPPVGSPAPPDAGPPAGAGPPAHAGPPAGAGAPADAGPPADAGAPASTGPPADAGPKPKSGSLG
ncbi:MAG: sigma-70 family RNA polymerase sigma factor [Solirubrobacterales bacterium]